MILLSLFGHQPIVERRTGTTNMERSSRRGSKAHAGWLIERILAFQGKDRWQLSLTSTSISSCQLGSVCFGRGRTEKGTIGKVLVEALALECFNQGDSRVAGTSRTLSSNRFSRDRSRCGRKGTTGRNKGLMIVIGIKLGIAEHHKK